MTPRKIASAEERVRPLSHVGDVKVSDVDALYTLAWAWVEAKDKPAAGKTVKAKSLGEAVKAAREAAGLSVAELADRAGITRQAVGDIERGKTADPKLSVARKLAAALGVRLEDLAG